MGVYVKKVGSFYRLMDDRTDQLATRSDTGKSVDGGGHSDRNKAERQAAYVNYGLMERGLE